MSPAMNYDPELPGCFDEGSLAFASSEQTRDHAFFWLAKLREQETVWADVQTQIERYLCVREAGAFHVIDQVDRAKLMLGPWLYG